jgi:hypothetical protein
MSRRTETSKLRDQFRDRCRTNDLWREATSIEISNVIQQRQLSAADEGRVVQEQDAAHSARLECPGSPGNRWTGRLRRGKTP